MPLSSGLEVNEGKATTDQYFVLQNLCTRIDESLRLRARNTHVGMTRKPACTLSTPPHRSHLGIRPAGRTIRAEAIVPTQSTIFGHFHTR
jgi:hypothetical protein